MPQSNSSKNDIVKSTDNKTLNQNISAENSELEATDNVNLIEETKIELETSKSPSNSSFSIAGIFLQCD